MWDKNNPRVKNFPPEILRADLVPLVLECSDRGIYSVEGIDWLDSPSAAAWAESVRLLQQLGMIKKDGRIMEKNLEVTKKASRRNTSNLKSLLY